MAKDYVLEKRKYVIGGVALAIVLIYLVRLFSLQIATDDYKKNADSNAFLNKIQYPSRGAMYDRNDKLLVFNQPAYDITMVPKEVENLDTLDLCQTLNITRAQFLRIMSDMKDRRRNPWDIHVILIRYLCLSFRQKSVGCFRRNYLNSGDSIYSVAPFDNIVITLLPMCLVISVRYQ